jgi:hypothetical protein
MQLLISCTVRDQVKRYLNTHGITGYELSEGHPKDTWWSGGGRVRYPKDGGMSEIIGAMIASDYEFSVKGSTRKAAMDNMWAQINARLKIVELARNVQGVGFPGGKNSPDAFGKANAWNSSSTPSQRIGDFVANPSTYTVSCFTFAMLVMSGGIMNSMGNLAAFNNAYLTMISKRETSDPDDWVPGDMGKIVVENPIEPRVFGSETVIYAGSNQWRGHEGPLDTLRTLTGWLAVCAGWSKDQTNYTAKLMPTFGANVGEDRFFPNVGLE